MARESLGWRERGQANRTRNPRLYFSVRGEKKKRERLEGSTKDQGKGDGGVQETRRRDSEGPLGNGSGVIFTTHGVSSGGAQHAIDGNKEKGRYIDKSRATAYGTASSPQHHFPIVHGSTTTTPLISCFALRSKDALSIQPVYLFVPISCKWCGQPNGCIGRICSIFFFSWSPLIGLSAIILRASAGIGAGR